MKKIVIIGLVLLSGGYSFSQQNKGTTIKKTAPAKAVATKAEEPAASSKPITFTNMVIERSNIKKGTDDLFIFEFKNTGKTPVLIQGVQTSCGCTTANKPEGPIAPGEKSNISVKYDTNRIGAFEKTITITTNVQTEPIVLTIKGTVLAEE